MALTHTAIKNAKKKPKQYRLSDSGNLYLLVRPNGSKLWRLDYSILGKRKTMALGSYPVIDLKTARAKRDEAKNLLSEGVDPVRHRQLTVSKQKEAVENSFQRISMEWFSRQEKSWSKGHARTVTGRLELNLLPWLGQRPISEISPQELLKVLRKIEARGAIETAHRCKTIVSQVFRYAISAGLADRDPAADLKGALTPTKAKKMAAITEPKKVKELLSAIRGYEGHFISRCALQLSALTFVRPGELRQAEWQEINWTKKEWLIPANKMKAKRDHTVPLAEQALAVLQELEPFTGEGRYIFPSLRTTTRPMSNNTVLGALRRMGFSKEEMTPHGFRSMASTLLHENGWEHEIIELQLAHTRRDRVAAAYDRSRRLPDRRKMMQWWADYLDKLEQQ